ncbi:MAG: hypothetical protein PF961_02845 [Planctomycetota bacterium]|jgi:lysyl-tRNA synthetase class 2|nr:hypothetical protein [Planctomycetota bacterium]
MTADWQPSASLATLQARERLMRATRAFFHARGVLEVDVPLVQSGANCDRGVVPMALDERYLITSPEHPLKRLLAAGYGDVWASCPCFRSGEQGQRHAPEFRMLEWYRCGFTLTQLITETVELLATLTELAADTECYSYRDAFRHHLDLDPMTASENELLAALDSNEREAVTNRLDCLDLLLSEHMQPHFAPDRWTVISDWPADQAAQARLLTDPADGAALAARFEVYRGRLELANGYHECCDADELSARLHAEGKAPERSSELRPDAHLAAAMRHGLPDCCGVALGFDRAVLLATGVSSLAETMAFDWNRA